MKLWKLTNLIFALLIAVVILLCIVLGIMSISQNNYGDALLSTFAGIYIWYISGDIFHDLFT